MNIIVHNPTNEKISTYRYYNIFFDQLIEYLKTKFSVVENRYFEDAHRFRMPVILKSEEPVQLLECEMIIENSDTKDLYILSVADFFTDANFSLFNNLKTRPFIKKILVSQYNKKNIMHHCYDINNFDEIYSPWIYFPFNNYDFDSLYHKRLSIDNKIDKLYFSGSGIHHRPIVELLDKKIFYYGQVKTFDKYANELINYKIGLSLAGTAQFCYRDVEYMAMGIPFLRFEYSNEMKPPLIPNYHYISVGQKLELKEEHSATKYHSELIEQKFLEIHNDIEFLNYISTNAKYYYETYLKGANAINHTMNLLGL